MDEEKRITHTEVPELPAATEEKPAEASAETAAPADAAPETEAASAANDEAARKAAIDEMEKASQKALDAMREAGNERNEEVVDNAEKKLEDIFDQLKAWMQTNTQPERVKAEMKTAIEKVNETLEKTRQGVIEVAESDQFKKTMEAGKDFVIGTGTMIADGLQYGYDKLLEIPEFKKAADFVGSKVDDLRHSEALKSFVDRSEEGLSQLNASIFNGLKSFFTPQDSEKKEDLPDLPEDNDQDSGAAK